jgi:hypothetical protein
MNDIRVLSDLEAETVSGGHFPGSGGGNGTGPGTGQGDGLGWLRDLGGAIWGAVVSIGHAFGLRCRGGLF